VALDGRRPYIQHMAESSSLVPGHVAAGERTVVRWLLLMSGICLLVQTFQTHYGAGHQGEGVFWFLVGALLLWFVYRRSSRVARGLIVVTSLFGAVAYGIQAPGDAHAALVALACLGQALPLLSGPVRRHVQVAGRDETTPQTGTSSTAPTA
jgi:hypothetical protein